jgi:hypothetical protein
VRFRSIVGWVICRFRDLSCEKRFPPLHPAADTKSGIFRIRGLRLEDNSTLTDRNYIHPRLLYFFFKAFLNLIMDTFVILLAVAVM